MKPEVIGLGILTLVAGLILVLKQLAPKIIPAFLTNPYTIMGILIVIGILHIAFGFSPMNTMLAYIGIIGIVIVVLGVLPVLAGFMKFIPAFLIGWPVYPIIICLIGLAEAGIGANPNTF